MNEPKDSQPRPEFFSDPAVINSIAEPVPVEPENLTRFINCFTPLRDYIDTLQSDLQRATERAQGEFRARERLQSRINELEGEKSDWSNGEESQRERAEAAESLNKRMVELLRRYRNETPLGNQPAMIAHEVDELLKEVK